ncbi:MAG: hypothetical protein L6R40_004761 [Gallowayella cf. fulva]|nr:MAG: hypothetical protein L6R40_004761 [Xanthomendoza cf. fulva]
MLVLEGCKHQFHEYCLMEWLSPIRLPQGSQDLDPIMRMMEARSNLIHTLGRLPFSSAFRKRFDQLTARDLAEGRLQALIPQAMAEVDAMDEELEEVENGEEHLFHTDSPQGTPTNNVDNGLESQNISPVNLLTDIQLTRNVLVQEIRRDTTSPTCPYCRQPANINNISCHTDTLQIIRVRLRLANLAYQCFNFKLNRSEIAERRHIQQFLLRRFLDNILLSPEPIPTPPHCRRIFTLARLTLREQVFRYTRAHRLTSHEQLRITQLATFYENFALRDKDIKWFFEPDAHLDLTWDFTPSAGEFRLLHRNPREFCQRLSISKGIHGLGAPSLRVPPMKLWTGEVLEVGGDKEAKELACRD